MNFTKDSPHNLFYHLFKIVDTINIHSGIDSIEFYPECVGKIPRRDNNNKDQVFLKHASEMGHQPLHYSKVGFNTRGYVCLLRQYYWEGNSYKVGALL